MISEQQAGLLERFVLRARIVQDHSLAADFGRLQKLASYEVKMNFIRNLRTGETSAEFRPVYLVPTEQLESAAARVRPIFLKSDKVHYEAVLDALLTALKGRAGAAGFAQRVKALRKDFRGADPDYPHGKPEEPWDGGAVSNKQLAGSWLYGHLLHEDEKRRSYGARMHLEEMFLDAMRTVSSEMLATVRTLHLIEEMQVAGFLQLPEPVFTDEVTVKASFWAPPGNLQVFVAPLDTPMPKDLSADLLAEGWSDAVDEFLPPRPEKG